MTIEQKIELLFHLEGGIEGSQFFKDFLYLKKALSEAHQELFKAGAYDLCLNCPDRVEDSEDVVFCKQYTDCSFRTISPSLLERYNWLVGELVWLTGKYSILARVNALDKITGVISYLQVKYRI